MLCSKNGLVSISRYRDTRCSVQRTALWPFFEQSMYLCCVSISRYRNTCCSVQRTALCPHLEFWQDLSRLCSTSTVHKGFLLSSHLHNFCTVSPMEVGSSTVDRLCQMLPTTFDGEPTVPNCNAAETRRSLSRSEVALHEKSVALDSRLKHQHSDLDEFLASEKVVATSHEGARQRGETSRESRYMRTIFACL